MPEEYRYIFGPIPSRRLGRSLGVSPIPKKVCNYSCIYCQLGRTDRMTNSRRSYFPPQEILEELSSYLKGAPDFDVVTLVGEGEPTLSADLGLLIRGIQHLTDKPVAVITNGALLGEESLREELMAADIVLPSLDAPDEATFRRVDRPMGSIRFEESIRGLETFAREYKGQLWVEVMLVGGVNDSDAHLEGFRKILSRVRHDRVYINTPVRPPAEEWAAVASPERIHAACQALGGISIEMLSAGSFFSEIPDSYEAILGIIGRHPMNQFEVASFLSSRGEADAAPFLSRLHQDSRVETVPYKGYETFRLR